MLNEALRRPIEVDDWVLHAACRGRVDLFFAPDTHESRTERREREARAKEVCAACAVRAECLAQAVANRERFGIWGGLNARERRAALKRAEDLDPSSQDPSSQDPSPQDPSPQDIAGPGRPARLPAVVVQGRPMSPEED